MPRYSLRTLLILLAVAGLVFARIGYLKRMSDYHRLEVAQLATAISMAEAKQPQEIISSIQAIADGGESIVPGDEKSNMHRRNWLTIERAVIHQDIANRYDRAMYRPWMLVSEKDF